MCHLDPEKPYTMSGHVTCVYRVGEMVTMSGILESRGRKEACGAPGLGLELTGALAAELLLPLLKLF